LVLAGAGTGKTRTLTARLAYLLRTGRARPGEILAVTFTNKAAREMTNRVAALMGRPVENWWLGTFHALGVRILRRHVELVGLKPGFSILDTDDQVRLLKQLMEVEGIDDKKWPARVLATIIQRWKDRGLGPENIGAADAGDFAGGKAADLYTQYQSRLRILNAVDFGDLLLLCIKLFQKHADILAEYQQRFRYLLVDEYQDTNVAQYLWLRLLAQNTEGKTSNICCVGDDDQSIYGWRGAEVGNILRFERDFPGATVFAWSKTTDQPDIFSALRQDLLTITKIAWVRPSGVRTSPVKKCKWLPSGMAKKKPAWWVRPSKPCSGGEALWAIWRFWCARDGKPVNLKNGL